MWMRTVMNFQARPQHASAARPADSGARAR